MKKSKAEMLQEKINKAEIQLEKVTEQVKKLKREITQLKKEKEDAEMAELQSFMKEYDITPREARSIMEQLQGGKKEEVVMDEEGNGTGVNDASRI